MAIGEVPAEAIRPFTLVLKGVIAMSRARWPQGLAGRDIDAIARAPLWRAGLDYDHGTGHGVGVYLGVHEGPQSLSRRRGAAPAGDGYSSVEPGYYRDGAFGIRTENLVIVRAPETPEGGDRPMPRPRPRRSRRSTGSLIDPGLLDTDERAWLDAYRPRAAALGPAGRYGNGALGSRSLRAA